MCHALFVSPVFTSVFSLFEKQDIFLKQELHSFKHFLKQHKLYSNALCLTVNWDSNQYKRIMLKISIR